MNLIVTLANEPYLEKAKQVFSSIYFNGKWRGQCMLLAQGIAPQKLTWFRERGIQVKECPLLYQHNISGYDPVVTAKMHLFDVEMKKWKNIVYVDADVIVRKPLSNLFHVDHFTAKAANNNSTLRQEFITPTTIWSFTKLFFLQRKYDFNTVAFNTGVMAFNTDIIELDTVKNIQRLLRTYGNISKYGEQAVLNLYFYNKWQPMDESFNVFPRYYHDTLAIPPQKLSAAILHFADVGKKNKPWDSRNFFYREWKLNLERSGQIQFEKPSTPSRRS